MINLKLPKRYIALLGCVLVLFIGFLDYITGYKLGFSIKYYVVGKGG